MNDTRTTAAETGSFDDRYGEFLESVQACFDNAMRLSPYLFETDATGLWEAYLDNAPAGERQTRNCNCCRQFIERFGGLVTIDERGYVSSAIWAEDQVPPAYSAAARALRRAVARASVTGVFRSREPVWGTPNTGPWSHIALVVPRSFLSTSVVTTPFQEMAAKREEYGMLGRSLGDFGTDTVRKAVALLSTDALYRSEKCLGVAKWLLDLHEAQAQAHLQQRANLLWLAVAKAPAGFCHVRSSMIGTLLEDLASNHPYEVVKRKFAEKMNPQQYMRPQAAPSAGNIAQAEKIVAALQSQGALERRFAKLSDVQAIWTPKPKQEAPNGGVFGHLKPKNSAPLANDAPPVTMTWVKFLATVLPTAESIEYFVPLTLQSYTALVTAKNPDAPNLLQWDNPVSHYMYSDGSAPTKWNLVAGQHRRVTAIVLGPWMWNPERTHPNHGECVNFILEGCRDTTYRASGGMFPEQMKSEYHPVRRTLKAYFRSAVIEGRDEAEACGIALGKGASWNAVFRVTAGGVRTTYKLDRWD